MLNFRAPEIADAARVRAVVERAGGRGNELNFANVFLLRKKHQTSICFCDGFWFRRYGGTRLNGYSFPMGDGDVDAALRTIADDADARSVALKFCSTTFEQTSTLRRVFPGKFVFYCDAGDSDYLYSRERSAETPGRRFHRKRNAIKRFEATRPNWRFETFGVDANVSASNERILSDVGDVFERWFAARDGERVEELASERGAIADAFAHFSALRLRCGVLYVDDAPVAATVVSETTPDVCDVHFEKTIPNEADAYSLIYRETARRLTAARWIDREEDLNLPGLRNAKLSWFPEETLAKYRAIPVELVDEIAEKRADENVRFVDENGETSENAINL